MFLKTKQIAVCALCAGILLALAGCDHAPKPPETTAATEAGTSPAAQILASADLYTVTYNSDHTISCEILDRGGNLLFSKEDTRREPKIKEITPDILEVTVQAGTGLSTNWAVYCDVESSRVSEVFHYVLLAQGEYVLYADYKNGEHSVTVQNMFDKAAYCQTYPLADCSPAVDLVTGAKPGSEGTAIVTYLTGETYTPTEITVTIP